MPTKLFLTVFRKPWAIDERALMSYMPLVERMNNGEVVSWKDNDDADADTVDKKFHLQVIAANNYRSSFRNLDNTSKLPENSVAVIQIKDVIMKEDYCGSPGTDTMQQWLAEANGHPNVAGTVLWIDSPGGSAEAMMEMSAAVKQSSKPVVALGEWLVASAAYGIASSSSEILLTQSLSEVGSIGTMMKWRNYDGAYKAKGVDTHEVYATKSKDKNKIFSEANKGNYKGLIDHCLDPFNEEFLAMVQVNRNGKLSTKENVLSGKTYYADNAITHGLADGMGTMEDAVNRVIELHKQNKA